MKEKKTTDAAVKKRNLYFIIIAVCVLLLAAVTVFTVLIATDRPGTSIDNPGGNGGEEPGPGPTSLRIRRSYSPCLSRTPRSRRPIRSGIIRRSTSIACIRASTLRRKRAPRCALRTAARIESITDDLLEGGKIVIDHGDGLKTVYSSIDVNSSMKVGASVSAGDQIGTVSATTDVMGKEYNEGSHLHFETMENDQFINPTAYLDIEEK